MIFVTETVASNWSPWESWSTCSTTCGKGVKIRERIGIDSNYIGCSGPDVEEIECGDEGDGDDKDGCPS